MSALTATPYSALATMRSRAYARSMQEATDQLVALYADELSAGHVLAAVSRAKVRARAQQAQLGTELPSPHDYATQIQRAAQQDLVTSSLRIFVEQASVKHA